MSSEKKPGGDMAFSMIILLGVCMLVTWVYRIFLYTVIPFSVRFYFHHRIFCVLVLASFTTLFLAAIAYGISCFFASMKRINDGAKPNPNRLRIGVDEKGKAIFVTLDQRKMHTQVIGTTNAGKTESIVVPWCVDDLKNGRGFIIIDGKSERKLVDKLWGYIVKYRRSEDFLYLNLSDPEISKTFNPLIGDNPEEVVERVFSAFEFENEFYKNLQRMNLAQILRIFNEAYELPTFARILECIMYPEKLVKIADPVKSESLRNWAQKFKTNSEREKENSGLTSQLSIFADGGASVIFNSTAPEIDLEEALAKNKIVYFQLPAMKHPFLGRATGKLVLQALQSAISTRHLTRGEHKFFSVYLDDFTEYLFEGFVTLLNKSRSANVGIVFAHQAKGDLDAIGPAAANAIMTNSNIKIVMRSNAPDTAEYFAKVIGTRSTEKHTERKKRGFLGNNSTGDISARETEEYQFHPQVFKEHLGTGWAVVALPNSEGTTSHKVKLEMLPEVPEGIGFSRRQSKPKQERTDEKSA